MNTYFVVVGSSAYVTLDRYIVRANNCAQAEEKALKEAGKVFDQKKEMHCTEIKLASDTFIK